MLFHVHVAGQATSKRGLGVRAPKQVWDTWLSCHTNTGITGPVHIMEVLFPEYFQSISRIFLNDGEHLHTMELYKTMENGFSNLFLQYFQNIPMLRQKSNFCRWNTNVQHLASGVTKEGNCPFFVYLKGIIFCPESSPETLCVCLLGRRHPGPFLEQVL